MKTIKLFLLSVLMLILLVSGFQLAHQHFASRVAAQASNDFSGWAWNNKVGWISFAGTNYAVSVEESSGNVSGYAWANPKDPAAGTDNIGWLSFESGDVSGCPSGTCQAKIDSSGNFTGWARFLAGKQSLSLVDSPSAANQLATFNASMHAGVGVIASDGAYLYVKAWSGYGGSGAYRHKFAKIGSGYGGTTAGQYYGNLISSGIHDSLSAAYLDGYVYNGYTSNGSNLERVDINTGSRSFASASSPILNRTNGKNLTGSSDSLLITSDGTFLYSVAYSINNGGYNGWTIKVFKPAGATLQYQRTITSSGSSYYTDGVFTDGKYLYAIQWCGCNGARVTRISLFDGSRQGQWTLNQGVTDAINGQFDWVNNVVWLGGLRNTHIYKYKSPLNPIPLGWDGWVQLSGNWTNPVHVVSETDGSCQLEGWAWGGETLGWISFNSKTDGSPNAYAVTAPSFLCNRPPAKPTNLTSGGEDFCVNSWQILFSWNYSDPNNDPQGAYQIQISSSQTDFSSPVYNSGKVSSSQHSAFINLQRDNFNYGNTYWFRVKVWDDKDNESQWSDAAKFLEMPPHAYPNVQPPDNDFQMSPNPPSAGETVTFTDRSVCYDINATTGNTCSNVTWQFNGDTPNPPTAVGHQVQTVFQAPADNVSAVLNVCDTSGFCCSIGAGNLFNVKPPLPQYQEKGSRD